MTSGSQLHADHPPLPSCPPVSLAPQLLTDERASKPGEGLINVASLRATCDEPAGAINPGEAALDHPSIVGANPAAFRPGGRHLGGDAAGGAPLRSSGTNARITPHHAICKTLSLVLG